MLKFLTPSSPRPTPGAWPRSQNENSGWYILCILFVSTQTNFGTKIFEIYFANEMSWYLTFWPHPKVTSLTLWCKFYLHSVLLITPYNLIATLPCSKKIFLTSSSWTSCRNSYGHWLSNNPITHINSLSLLLRLVLYIATHKSTFIPQACAVLMNQPTTALSWEWTDRRTSRKQ